MASRKRKRSSLGDDIQGTRYYLEDSSVFSEDVYATLSTTTAEGKHDTLQLRPLVPFSIGRNPKCTYVLKDPVVSCLHCWLHVVSTGSNRFIVTCRDMSTNGIVIDGFKLRKTSAILENGATLSIPHSQTFKVQYLIHNARNKAHLFDPTPPPVSLYKVVGKYNITSYCLGSGSFATVHLAVEPTAYRQVACKTIMVANDKLSDRREWDKVMKEVKILKGLSHPNINKVLDVAENTPWLHIFLELATGGDLFTYITAGRRPNHRLVEGEAKHISFQLMKGLQYMHDLHVSHRGTFLAETPVVGIYSLSVLRVDLKPENVLLHDAGPYPRVVIADFGLARQRSYQATFNAVGTVPYMPPEAILALADPNATYVGMPADCWSLGCCIYCMLSGAHPFDCGPSINSGTMTEEYPGQDGYEESTVKSRIVRGILNFSEGLWNGLDNAKEIIGALLVRDPRRRLTIKEALQTNWIISDIRELTKSYNSCTKCV